MAPRDSKSTKPDAVPEPQPADEVKRPKRRFSRRIDCAGTPLSSPVISSDATPGEARDEGATRATRPPSQRLP